MSKKKSIILVSPFDSTFTIPLKRAFIKLGFSTNLFDYRNILGNLHHNPFIFLSLILRAFINIRLLPLKNFRCQLLNEMLVILCSWKRPNYLFVVKGEKIVDQTIRRINALGITTILWQVDPSFDRDYWLFIDAHTRNYAVYISCEPGSVIRRLKKQGFKNVLYMLGAADRYAMHFSYDEPKKYDISLVGTYHPQREKFLMALKGLDVHLWGWGSWQTSGVKEMFEGGALAQDEMLRVYKQSKIVINVSRSITSTIPTNLRPFEAAQVGGFILVDYKRNLSKVFTLGKEIDYFRTPQELRKKVEYYLRNPLKRKRVAHRMYKRVKRDHTYDNRLARIFQEIKKLGL